MASEPDVSEVSSALERLIRGNRDMSLFLPFIFGFSSTLQRHDFPQQQQQDQQNDDDDDDHNNNIINNNNNNNRVILINPFTQGMVVIQGASGLDPLLRELGSKGGPPPAARSAIEALPRVEISEECRDQDCVICLDEFGVGGFAKEMPCKHRFHENCIDKWLGIHGSCPVCRHKLPVDETEAKKNRIFEREIWVGFSFNGRRTSESESESESEESNESPSSGGGDDESLSNGNEVQS